jgi:hypothetical protein
MLSGFRGYETGEGSLEDLVDVGIWGVYVRFKWDGFQGPIGVYITTASFGYESLFQPFLSILKNDNCSPDNLTNGEESRLVKQTRCPLQTPLCAFSRR